MTAFDKALPKVQEATGRYDPPKENTLIATLAGEKAKKEEEDSTFDKAWGVTKGNPEDVDPEWPDEGRYAWQRSGRDNEGRRVDVHGKRDDDYGVSVNMSFLEDGSQENAILMDIANKLGLNYEEYDEGIGMHSPSAKETLDMLKRFLEEIGFRDY